MTDLIKQAEKNVIKVARQWEDLSSFLDALSHFGNKMLNDYIGKEDFFNGLSLMRNAVSNEYCNALSKCFCFAGVGGKEAQEYSREKFKEAFEEKNGLKYSVMHFLEENGRTPSSWEVEKERLFRKQAQEKIEEE